MGRVYSTRVLALLSFLIGCGASEVPTGVIVVSLDTLRADRLGAWGNDRGLTPNLDRFAAESVVFDQAFAQANETLYSHASLFTSRYPSDLGTLGRSFRFPAEVPTLAGTFRAAGWDTAAFVAGGHLSAVFGLDRGFATYDDTASFGSLRETGAAALHWLDRPRTAPFFLLVHGYDTHDRFLKPTPFGYAFADPDARTTGATLARTTGATSDIVGGYATRRSEQVWLLSVSRPRFERGRDIRALDPEARPVSPEDFAHIADVYDGSVAWADACFGLLMAGLQTRGLLDEVAIVVLSDHGEELGEAGVVNHHFSMSDATTHVPLMVRLPGGRGGGRRLDGLVELVDVAPTLVAMAGLPALEGAAGRDLSPALRAEPWTGREFALSEGELRLLTARGRSARLTAEGLRLENPFAAALLAVAPLDGVSLRLEGEQSEAAALRRSLVEHLR
jgi:arylsulfatase A-like enzyme